MLIENLKEIGCIEQKRYFLGKYEIYFYGGLSGDPDNNDPMLFLGVRFNDELVLSRKIEFNITAKEMKDILLEVIPAPYFTGS